MDAAREIALQSDWPLTFQLALNTPGSNHHQPSRAMATIGINASAMVQASSAPTTRGPRMLAKVRIQMMAAVASVLPGGASMCGISSARYPVAATAIAMLPTQ